MQYALLIYTAEPTEEVPQEQLGAEMEQYNAARTRIFNDAGCVIEGEKYVHKDDPAVVEKCVKEADELLAAEVEINALPLDIDAFGNAELQGAAFFALEWAMKQEGQK